MVKAVFLDRDGVINEDFGYVSKAGDFVFKPGVFDCLRVLQSRGFVLFVVSNQSGVGRGYFSVGDLGLVNDYMVETLEGEGVSLRGVFYCCHKPSDKCVCRKPSPFFVFKASKEFGVDLASSYFVGDKESDVLCGVNAGCKNSFLVKNGLEEVLEWIV